MTELDAVYDQFGQLELIVEGPLEYGRLIRCKVEGDTGSKRSGWYVVHELPLDNGDRITVGSYGNWKTGIERKLDITLPELTPEEKQAFADKQRELKAARDAETAARRKEAAEQSAKIWEKLPDTGSSEYLKRKCVGAWGVRFSRGTVVVPVRCGLSGDLAGLQFIAGDGSKKFKTGTAKRGACHTIPAARQNDLSTPILLVEGYATGAALRQAIGLETVVAFDAGNLGPVREAIHARCGDLPVVFCADNDHENPENPGVNKARAAAMLGDAVLVPPIEYLGPNLSDWNDVLVHHGIDRLKSLVNQVTVMAALTEGVGAGPVGEEPPLPDEPPPDSFPEPHQEGGRPTLEKALQRFALSMPSAKVYDYHARKLLGQRQAKAFMGIKVFNEWLEHGDRRDINDDVSQTQASQAEGEGDNPYAAALKRYTYLYPTDTAWDHDKREIVALTGLRYAMANVFDQWLKSPQRRQIDKDRLVFDPCNRLDPTSHINMFRGYPLSPDPDHDKSNGIRQVIYSLCNEDDEVFGWLLDWLAYPLQHIGAKMATAVLMHSETQGTGKSLLFDGYIKSIYGDYAATLGQNQLESQYTEWRSQKTYCLFEELFSRDGKYSHTGELKHMITGSTHRIEKKFVSGWEEANHMNAVFLSNEVQPFPIEASDRRMLVVWPNKKLPPDVEALAVKQLSDGGAASLYSFLLARDLKDFDPHTKPPLNEAKRRLIQFGRPGWDIFHEDWKEGRLPVPYLPCMTRQLFKVYEYWCHDNRERAMSMNKLTGFLSTRERVRRDLHYLVGSGKRKKASFIMAASKKPDDEKQEEWLAGCAAEFDRFATEYVKGDDNAKQG